MNDLIKLIDEENLGNYRENVSLKTLTTYKVGGNARLLYFPNSVDSLKKVISDKTVAIVAIAGTTELGLIDPIEEISKIAFDNNIYFHVDAAFGGFSIPFLKQRGYDLPTFDFSLSGSYGR